MLENQTDFGLRISVSRQCVASYIKRRKLTGAALVERDGAVLIEVEEALKQLGRRLDPDQRIANGKAKLFRKPTAEPQPAAARPAPDMAAVLSAVIRDIPSGVAWAIVAQGGTMQQGYDAYRTCCRNIACDVRLVLDADISAEFDPVSWAALGEEYGHAVDLPAIEAEYRRRDAAGDL